MTTSPPASIVTFLPMTYSAQVVGQFSSGGSFTTSVYAEVGQYITINAIPITSGLEVSGTVVFPSGKQTGGPGGLILSQSVPETGIYTINYFRNLMISEADSGVLIVEVILLPSGTVGS